KPKAARIRAKPRMIQSSLLTRHVLPRASPSPGGARRARAVLALAVVAFATGAIVGANRTATPANSLASSFVAAWTRADYTSMYLDVDPVTRSTVSPAEFVSAYRRALRSATATASSVAGRARSLPAGVVEVP